jgi:hypothetical protein
VYCSSEAVVPHVGCAAPWRAVGLPRGALRGKARQGALEAGFSEVVRLFTTEVSLDHLREMGWVGLIWLRTGASGGLL